MAKWNVIIAIIAIVGLAAYAVSQGIDGALVGTAFTILGGLGGYTIAKAISKPKSKD